jgi:hypothetical protein
MSFRFHSHVSCAMLGATVAALTGCAGHSDFMVEAPSTYTSAMTASSATIVFFRDSGVAYAVNFAILDQAANFLGDAVARSDFSVQVPPGRYFLVAKGGEGTDAVQAEVAAGRVYYVRVIPRMGMWLAGVELDPIKPGEQEWQGLSRWLTQTNHLTPLVPKVPVALSESPLPDWAAKAWGGLSPAERASRTFVPTDGLAFGSSPTVVSPPPLAVVEPRQQF